MGALPKALQLRLERDAPNPLDAGPHLVEQARWMIDEPLGEGALIHWKPGSGSLLACLAIAAFLVSPASAPAASRPSAAFRHGEADRHAWEDWFAGQTGEVRAGAAYWASHRSLIGPSVCAGASSPSTGPEWTEGCLDAQKHLAEPDRSRRTSRAYRRGWNSVPAAPPPQVTSPAAANPQSTNPAGFSVGPTIIWLVIGGAIGLFVLNRLGRRKKLRAARRQPATLTSDVSPVLRPVTGYDFGPSVRLTPQFVDRAVSAEDLRSESAAAWRRAGDAVRVADIAIAGGMIYVGPRLRARDGFGTPENCLIDPSLDAGGRPTDNPDQHLAYWPSYSRLHPSTRWAYLRWLASDRSNPETPIGYVFLYFYGLERRLMLDADVDDRDAVLGEVERLQVIYGHNHSFQGYSDRLVQAARFSAGSLVDPAPVFQREGYELPLGVRVALGRYAAARQPIPPDWVLSWVMSDPQLQLRTAATRDLEVFREVFAMRWTAAKPGGVTFTDTQIARFPKVKAVYRAASNTFNVQMAIGETTPDVTAAGQTVNKAHQVALKCCDELDGYSRLIGRRPDLKGSIGAGALLPADTRGGRAAQDAVRALSTRATPPSVAEVVALFDAAAPPEKITATGWRNIAELLAGLGYGVAPDPGLTLVRIAPALPAVLYPLPEGTSEVPEPMLMTAFVVQIGALIAAADGVVTPEEKQELHRAADMPGLDPRQKARLGAHADWLLSTDAQPSGLKIRLAQASPQARTRVVDIALDMARLDGRILAAEVRALEQVFEWLGLPTAKLYSALQGGEPVEVAGAVAAPAGQTIPSPEPKRRRLDKDKIAVIVRDSARSTALLQSVFSPGEEAPAAEAAPEQGQDATFPGLSAGLAAFARALCERETWAAPDLAALALAHGAMLEGAVERVNDWALDRWGDLLIEEGDPTHINRTMLNQAVEA